MRVMKFITVVAVLAMLSTFALGHVAQNAPVAKHVPISQTCSSSGKEMFKIYRAVCPGLDGKGNGPAAPAMKTNPLINGFGTEIRRQVSGATRGRCHPRTG